MNEITNFIAKCFGGVFIPDAHQVLWLISSSREGETNKMLKVNRDVVLGS